MRLPRLGTLGLLCALLSLPILSGCVTTTVSNVKTDSVRVACQSFEPITWSAKDTDKTLAQIKEFNAAWVALCRTAKK